MIENVSLYDRTKMPVIGLGLWKIDPKDLYTTIHHALKEGYTHFDTATFYQNDIPFGNIIKTSSLDRTDVFISTKLPAHLLTYDAVKKHYSEALSHMSLDYFNLFMINAPWPWNKRGCDYAREMNEVWRAMEDLYLAEEVSAIGVSNFQISDLENLIKQARIVPMTNQINVYPGHVNQELLAYCKRHHITVQGYSPFKQGSLLKHPLIKSMADLYQVTPAQLILKFLIKLNVYPIYKTIHPSYLTENLRLDFEILQPHIEQLIDLKDS